MGSVRLAAVAAGGLVLMTIGGAQAADLMPYEPPMIEPLPAMELRGGVYVRGYVGMTNQGLRRLDFVELHDPDYTFTFHDKGGFDSGMLFGGGVGYAFNEWVRMDVTGEYRGKTAFTALDHVRHVSGAEWTNEYSASKSELLFLVNAYVDLGTWKGLTPYVGAGIGASRNTISHFRDINVSLDGVWFAPTTSKWNLAWALHAGLGFDVTDQLTLDLGYRYVNLGDASTGTNYDAWGVNPPLTPIHFKGLHSHDVMLGLRWHFGHEPVAYDYPVRAKY